MPAESEEELTDPFADLDSQESDLANLDELITPLNSGVTAAEYLNQEDGLATCFTIDETENSDWQEQLRAEALADITQPKKSAVEEEQNIDSSDEEVECSTIQSVDTALTLSKDLLLFLVEKGEEEAAENQQKVISSLEEAKVKMNASFSKQTTLDCFMKH